MAVNRYSGYTASFNNALHLAQLGSVSASLNNRFTEITPMGAVDRAAVVLASAEPQARIQTRDLATVFGTVSPTVGYDCTAVSTLRMQKRLAGGVFAGSTNNVTATAQKGFLAPGSLSASGDSPAELELMFWALYDGTNEPFVFTDSVDFTAVTAPAYNSVFYLGPVYVNGSQQEGVTSVRVDFGIGYSALGTADGTVWPRSGTIVRRNPSISITLLKGNIAPSPLTSLFNMALPGTIACYFTKGVTGGNRVAAATAQHCKVSATSGQWNAEEWSTSGEDDATITITSRPTTTLAVSVASAIP